MGETLTSTSDQWQAFPAPTFTYHWQRCEAESDRCADIRQAPAKPSYKPTDDDVGWRIRVIVEAQAGDARETIATEPTGTIQPGPA